MIERVIEAHRYPNLKQYYNGDLEQDTLDCLEQQQMDSSITEKLKHAVDEGFVQLAEEDELSEIYENLFEALKMNKTEMIDRIKSVLTQLEDKNLEFCNRQDYAMSLIRGIDL